MGEGLSKMEATTVISYLSTFRKEQALGCYTHSDDEDDLSGCDGCDSQSPRNPPCSRAEAGDTLIVFDWDDTLLCTSAINRDSWTDSQLRQLERIGEDVLRACMTLGETIIITNGVETWVQASADRYLPGLLPVLSSMRVLSARAQYEDQCPGDPYAWKKHAFTDVLAERQKAQEDGIDGPLNLVVVGDSEAEIEAARYATKYCGGCSPLLKTIKFKDCPTVTELLGQLRRVAQELEHIVDEHRSTHRSMEQRELPENLDHLANWATGWRCSEKKERQLPLAPLLNALFA